MKVAQNDETNPNTLSVHLSHTPSIANIELFPSGSSVRKCQTSGKHSRMLYPFDRGVYHHVRTRLALPVVLLCTCLLCIYCFSPPLLFGRPRDDADAPVVDYVTDDPSFLSQQPGKPPPLITRYRLFFSILLALE